MHIFRVFWCFRFFRLIHFLRLGMFWNCANGKNYSSWTVRHFWQVLYTLCIVTETSWKISDIGSDNFQMISVIFHMMFGKWQIQVKSFFAQNVFPGPETKKQKRLRSLELNVLPGARTRFLIAFIFCDLRQKEWFLVN